MTSLPQQWVTEQAERRPDAAAVLTRDQRLTNYKSRAPLRLLLVTDGRTIPNWLYQCLRAVEGSRAATVVLTLHAAREEGWKLRRLLFSLYETIDRYLFRMVPDALAPIDLQSTLPNCRVVDLRRTPLARALEAAERVDVVLDPFSLMPEAGLADLSTYGVWSVPFGRSDDPRTRSTPGFWEVIEGKPSTETRLCIEWKGSDGKRSLYWCVAPTDRRSVSRSKSRLYWKISAALARNLLGLAEDPDAFVQRLAASAPSDGAATRSGAPAGAPGNLEMLRAGTRLVRRYASDKCMRTLYREQWTLAYQHGSSNRPVTGPFHTLVPPIDRYWADPFPIRVGNEYYIFHEEAPLSHYKGSIVLSVVDNAGKTAGPIPILEQDYHLSYPFVFQWDGEFFMIPETASHHQVELYHCVTFPSRWKLERVLLSGLEALDPTPAFLFGRWWLFAAIPVSGAGTSGELHLFYADSPLGPWTPHRANPVNSDVRSARPAGRIFENDGQFYRPAQDCSRRYGYAVSINRILQLNPDTYREVEVDKIVPDGEPGVAGVHTFNVAGDLTVIDCLVRRRKFWTDPWRRTLQLDRGGQPGSTDAAARVSAAAPHRSHSSSL
jgi:hypothetical protein